MSPKVKPEDCKSGRDAENLEKNRVPEILPGKCGETLLWVMELASGR